MKNSRQISAKPTTMIVCLTLLFVAAQLVLFGIHYHVTDLIDSVSASSIAIQLLQPVILMPLLSFVLLQVLAYVLLVSWVIFIARHSSELLRLNTTFAYGFAIVCWFLACAAILLLNSYFYPSSFFAIETQINNILLTAILFCLLLVTCLAYLNMFCLKRVDKKGIFFLTLILAFAIYSLPPCGGGLGRGVWCSEAPHPNPPPQGGRGSSNPNVIIIGLDSLRPDFVGYFNHQPTQTPGINTFLQSATIFTQAYTPLARTFPAWVSILTAKYPKHHFARTNLAEQSAIATTDTLAKRLQQSGYYTVYATDEKRFSNITAEFGFDRLIGPKMGVNDFLLGGLSDFPLTNLLVNLPFSRFLFPYNYGNRAATITYQPERFLQLMQHGLTNRPNKPIFLAIHLCLTHWPFTWAHDGQSSNAIMPERYQSSVQTVDAQFAALTQYLKTEGLLENTIVVLLSDHGTALGMPGDRVIKKSTYGGELDLLKLISVARYSSTPEFSLDLQNDYAIDTAYGQGTDLLSLTQHQVLLAFKGYGITLPTQQVTELSSLLDVAPTLLDLLHQQPLNATDGISWQTTILQKNNQQSKPRYLFLETGDSLSEIETDHIYAEKVIKHEIGIFKVNPTTGFLFMDPPAQASVIKNKQLAILTKDWLLVRYPARLQNQLILTSNKQLIMQPHVAPAYYVLANLKSGEWTINLLSSPPNTAPMDDLIKNLKAFYREELSL